MPGPLFYTPSDDEYNTYFIVRVKLSPLQALTDPEGSSRLRLPDFKATGT
jgi:hypothetical protein